MTNGVNPFDEAFRERMAVSKELGEGGGLGFFKGNLQGVNFWKCSEADHDLDIIPYLAGPHDPYREQGKITYVLELFEHRDVGGIEGQTFICMEKTYLKRGSLPDGRPFKGSCPVCLHRQQLIQEGADEDLIKALKTSRYPRSIYNVVVYDNEGEQAKGVQVFHTSHYLMEQYLLKLSESSRREIEAGLPPRKNFIDPTAGYSIRFTRTGQGVNTRYYGHTLVPRNYQIAQATLDQAHVLDSLIHLPTFEEVYTAYWGVAPSGGGGQPVGTPAMARGTVTPPATGTGSPRGVPITPGAGAPQPTVGGAPAPVTPTPVAGAGQPGPAAPVVGGHSAGVGAPPAGPPAGTVPGPVTPAPGPVVVGGHAQPTAGGATVPGANAGAMVCPGGGQFGVNTMELPHCEQCQIFQPCVDENERLLAAQGAAAAPPVGTGTATPPPMTGGGAPGAVAPGGAPPSTVPMAGGRTPVGMPGAGQPVGAPMTRGEPAGTGTPQVGGQRQIIT